jgi:hypothetical protein
VWKFQASVGAISDLEDQAPAKRTFSMCACVKSYDRPLDYPSMTDPSIRNAAVMSDARIGLTFMNGVVFLTNSPAAPGQ